jgi:hypothetical protein
MLTLYRRVKNDDGKFFDSASSRQQASCRGHRRPEQVRATGRHPGARGMTGAQPKQCLTKSVNSQTRDLDLR